MCEQLELMDEICIWPDGTWLLRDEYSEHEWQWAGDDYRIVQVSSYLEEDEIDELISEGKL